MRIERVHPSRVLDPLFDSLLLPSFKDYYSQSPSLESIRMYAAYDPDLAGLIIGEFFPETDRALLQSIKVFEKHRRKGIGTKLLRQLEETVRHENISSLTTNFEETEAHEAFSRLLDKSNYSKPIPLLIRYFFDIPSFHPSWYDHPHPFKKGFTLHPFHEITEEEKNWIHTFTEQGAIPSELNPFSFEYPIEPINSVLLRQEGKLIGWMATHRTAKDIINYSSLYIWHDFRMRNLGVPLLAHSIKLHQMSPIRYATFELDPRNVTKAWNIFIQNRLAPNAFNKQLLIYRFKMIN